MWYVYAHVWTMAPVWSSEDSCWESGVSFHCVINQGSTTGCQACNQVPLRPLLALLLATVRQSRLSHRFSNTPAGVLYVAGRQGQVDSLCPRIINPAKRQADRKKKMCEKRCIVMVCNKRSMEGKTILEEVNSGWERQPVSRGCVTWGFEK